MSSFYVSNKKCKCVTDVNSSLKKRGPDKTIVDQMENLDVIYNILSLNDESEYWYRDDTLIVLYDGIIFNSPDSSVTGTAHFIANMYREYGPVFTRKLDGEYAICLIDLKNSLCVFSTDVFATKPMWYVPGQEWCVCSYKSAIQRSGHTDIKRAEPNTTYCYNYKTNILDRTVIHNFSLTQYKDSYDDWIKAFEKAIFKRAHGQKVYLGLSSGYDSGAIFCELSKKNYEFGSVSFRGKESMEVLLERIKMHQSSYLFEYDEHEFLCTLRELVRYCEKYQDEYYDILKDEATTGIGIICKDAKKNGAKILLSGCGAGDIMVPYFTYDGKIVPPVRGIDEYINLFPEDLSSIFPWVDFYHGSNQAYLTQGEYVSGTYGVQESHPFLDTALVQEYLWLDYRLKNKNYRAPVHEYFERNCFPFREEKIGFFIR